MKKSFACLTLLFAVLTAHADRIVVTVTNDSGLARPAETIAVPFAQIRTLLDPQHDNAQYWARAGSNITVVRFEKLMVKN